MQLGVARAEKGNKESPISPSSCILFQSDFASNPQNNAFPWGHLVSALEWTTLLCTHAHFGGAWKGHLAAKQTQKQNGHLAEKTTREQTENLMAEPTNQIDNRDALSENTDNPEWVSKCFQNQFRNIYGVFAILGIYFTVKVTF